MRKMLTLLTLALMTGPLLARVGVDTTGKTNEVSGPTDFGANTVVIGGVGRTSWPTGTTNASEINAQFAPTNSTPSDSSVRGNFAGIDGALMGKQDRIYSPANYFNYVTNNGEIKITYLGTNSVISVPPFINGLPVTKIEDSGMIGVPSLTSLSLPDSIANIGMFAIANSLVRNIVVPASVTNLDDWAFSAGGVAEGYYFKGDAPSLGGGNVFYGETGTVYYLSGATGFGVNFGGRPTAIWGGKVVSGIVQNNVTNIPDIYGNILLPSDINILSVSNIANAALPKTGGTMTGALILNAATSYLFKTTGEYNIGTNAIPINFALNTMELSNIRAAPGSYDIDTLLIAPVIKTAGNFTTTGRRTGLHISNPGNNGINGPLYSIFSECVDKSYFAGNVGIGTTNPVGKLDVVGNVRIDGGIKQTTASTNTFVGKVGIWPLGAIVPISLLEVIGADRDGGVITVGGYGGSAERFSPFAGTLQFRTTDNSLTTTNQIAGKIACVDDVGNGAGAALSFSTAFGSVLSEKMLIDHAGNVGIGTNAPSEKLEVIGNIKSVGLQITKDSPTTGSVWVATNTVGQGTWKEYSKFSVNPAAGQVFTNGSYTKVIFANTNFDVGSKFSNSSWIPGRSGYIFLTGKSAYSVTSSGRLILLIYRDGVEVARSDTYSDSVYAQAQVSYLDYCPSSTNVYELYLRNLYGSTVTNLTSKEYTCFQGFEIP